MRKLMPALLLLLAVAACRRPLYVTGDELYSSILHTDWSHYQSKNPDGMTAWFFPKDEQDKSFRYTTANVRELKFNVPADQYTGVVIDYSPAEYGKQEFVGMDYLSTALVQATVSGTQPDSLKGLYGPGCWREPIGNIREETGLYFVTNQPEPMSLDTLMRMDVNGGPYGYYIPYELRDTYQSEVQVQDFYAYPVSPLWQLKIRIFVKGFPMMYDVEGSVAGMANGRYLAKNRPTGVPCLISVTDWNTMQTGTDEGYINVTVKTFGLLAGLRPRITNSTKDGDEPQKESAVIADWTGTEVLKPDDIRLNLRFLLRDRATICYYHYDVGEHIVSYDDQLLLQLELGRDFLAAPDLPFVDPYNAAGFDADVTPWEDGGTADIGM